jgi:cell wall-associated NlpC family hydrolase
MGHPHAQSDARATGAEAQEVALLSKQYPAVRFDGQKSNSQLFESARDHADVIPPELTKPANFRRRSTLRSVGVLAVLVPGLFATVALPAYGATSSKPSIEARSSAALQHSIDANAQTIVVVAAAADGPKLTRDAIHYVAPAPVVHHQFTGLAQSYGSISITGVAAIAARYLGVPYVFGGESPRGFDCSGLVEYVYAQIGIRLPHSSMLQGHMGTRVSVANARPGDVVVFNGGSHVGIYVGGGHMIDAPYPGRVVSVDKIYSNSYWIVHY